jgi:folate-binding protein YgfZ
MVPMKTINNSGSDSPAMCPLSSRGFIGLEGEDTLSFLQGLITQDIRKLSTTPLLYSLMLTPQGKFLADFFIFTAPSGAVVLDCPAALKEALLHSLTRYKLRARVALTDFSDQYQAHALLHLPGLPDTPQAWSDPRHPDMGYRAYGPPPTLPIDPHAYLKQRLALVIPEGGEDLISGKSFPSEWGMDQVSAIDYDKGCYVGQELTARTKYRGTVRKHHHRVFTEGPMQCGDALTFEGEDIAVVTSVLMGVDAELNPGHGASGIALIRHEHVERFTHDHWPELRGHKVTVF